MILLDTNVISEPTRPRGEPLVLAWLDRQPVNALHLSATSYSELLAGVEVLPTGRRKEHLKSVLSALVDRLFGDRILPFDERAAVAYASLVARARANGYTIAIGDGQIAAIAAVHGFTVATRDVAPFQAAGVPVLNPWDE